MSCRSLWFPGLHRLHTLNIKKMSFCKKFYPMSDQDNAGNVNKHLVTVESQCWRAACCCPEGLVFSFPSLCFWLQNLSFDLFTGFITRELEEVEPTDIIFLWTSFISGVPWNGESCCPNWGLPPGLSCEPDPLCVLSSESWQPQVSVVLGWHQPVAGQGEKCWN